MGIISQVFDCPDPPCHWRTWSDVYIECGVQRGHSFSIALTKPFKRLYGIEVCERNFQHCVERFGGDGVHECPLCEVRQQRSIHLGTTLELLPRILDPSKWTTIFLDSHWSEGPDDEMDPKAGQCPLLAELAIIAATPWEKKPLLIVDDKRLFTGELWKDSRVNPGFKRHEWPTLGEIMTVLDRWKYNCSIRADQIWLW